MMPGSTGWAYPAIAWDVLMNEIVLNRARLKYFELSDGEEIKRCPQHRPVRVHGITIDRSSSTVRGVCGKCARQTRSNCCD